MLFSVAQGPSLLRQVCFPSLATTHTNTHSQLVVATDARPALLVRTILLQTLQRLVPCLAQKI